VLLIYVGGIPWLLTVLFVGVLGWREMAQLLGRDHFAVDRTLGLLYVAGTVFEAYARAVGFVQLDLLRPLLAGLIMLSLVWALFNRGEHPTADWGMTVACAFYLGFMLGHFVTLRLRADGLKWVVLAIGLTWIADTMAYFVGVRLGRHKLWSRISPKKTWEGLAGGTLGALIAAPLLGGWLFGLSPWQGLLLGILIAVADPFGDLAMSLFKRMARIKDSGQLIPGHGGILDRLDSLLFVVPVVTYFAVIVAGR
jgi:phosphatidate cytidylyltransferase